MLLEVRSRFKFLLLNLFAAALFPALNGFTQEINDLVFLHHSCGSNWLSNSLNAALVAKSYIDERNDITYGTTMPPDAGRPASLGGTPGDNTNMNHWIRWFNDYLQGVKQHACANGFNRIIMFKSCYPISGIGSNGTEPGDPFNGTQSLVNYKAVYRHPSGSGSAYSNGGYAYKPLEDIFAENPDILFIPVTAPPLNYGPYDATNDAEAHRARLFNNWLKNDWLNSYNALHPALENVAVFDWFDFLAFADTDPTHPNRLKTEYGGNNGDSHPNAAGNSASTVEFATKPGNFIDAAWNAFSTNPVLVKTKVFLEGPYQAGGSMTTNLNAAGSVPNASPYADARTVATVPAGVTDWVSVELRDSASGPAVKQRSFFLKSDGNIVDTDGAVTDLEMPGMEAGNYHIVVRHRNHLAVMSASAIALGPSPSALYDFSAGLDQYYGADPARAVELEPGVYGMMAGETNGTGTVTVADKAPVVEDLNESGYYNADANFSGTVTVADKFLIVQNLNQSTQVP